MWRRGGWNRRKGPGFGGWVGIGGCWYPPPRWLRLQGGCAPGAHARVMGGSRSGSSAQAKQGGKRRRRSQAQGEARRAADNAGKGREASPKATQGNGMDGVGSSPGVWFGPHKGGVDGSKVPARETRLRLQRLRLQRGRLGAPRGCRGDLGGVGVARGLGPGVDCVSARGKVQVKRLHSQGAGSGSQGGGCNCAGARVGRLKWRAGRRGWLGRKAGRRIVGFVVCFLGRVLRRGLNALARWAGAHRSREPQRPQRAVRRAAESRRLARRARRGAARQVGGIARWQLGFRSGAAAGMQRQGNASARGSRPRVKKRPKGGPAVVRARTSGAPASAPPAAWGAGSVWGAWRGRARGLAGGCSANAPRWGVWQHWVVRSSGSYPR